MLFPSLETPCRIALCKCMKTLVIKLRIYVQGICYINYSKSFIVSEQYEIIFFSDFIPVTKFTMILEYLL